MKTKSYNVYSLSELSPKARERAIDKARQHIVETWNGEDTIEDAKQAFVYAGLDIERVYYSGFSYEGGGASFRAKWEAKNVNPAEMRAYAPIDEELHRIVDGFATIAKALPGASFRVNQSGHYMHEYCTDFAFYVADNEGNYIGLEEKTEKELIELARDTMRWTYRQLEKEYDYQTSETQVIEFIEANEYEFMEDGEID